jgi:HEAT repeat protein
MRPATLALAFLVAIPVLAAPAAAPAGSESLASLKSKAQADDDQTGEEAAQKLAQSTDPKAVDAILDSLVVGASPRVQAALLAGLSGKKDARAVEALKHYAKNRNVELRKKALTALADLPDARATAPLVGGLADSVAEVRGAAAAALGKRKERSAEAKLIKLLQRKDAAATTALAAIASPELAHRISEMLGQIPDALFCETLGAMLKRTDFGPEPIRLEVVKALAKVPGIDSTSALVEYVAATEKDKQRPSRLEAQKIVDQRSSQ